MKRKKLILELTNRLQVAKMEAEKQKTVYFNTDFGNQVFANHVKQGMINPKYITFDQYQQIVEFYNFLQSHECLTDAEIKKLLKSKLCKFAFLRKLIKEVPNFIEELKQNGPRTAAIEFVSSKLF